MIWTDPKISVLSAKGGKQFITLNHLRILSFNVHTEQSYVFSKDMKKSKDIYKILGRRRRERRRSEIGEFMIKYKINQEKI